MKAFYSLADQLSLLSPHEAHRQLWNRGFKLRGGRGNNIPLDLILEHNNKFVKEMIANQIANVSFDSSQLVSGASEGIEAVLTNIDLSLRMESGKHAKLDKRKDVYTIAHRVLDGKMTEYCPDRAYKAFPTMETLRQPASVFTWARSTIILYIRALFVTNGRGRLWISSSREGFQPRQLSYEEVLTCAKIFCR